MKNNICLVPWCYTFPAVFWILPHDWFGFLTFMHCRTDWFFAMSILQWFHGVFCIAWWVMLGTLMLCPLLGPWSSKKASLFGQHLYQDVVKRLADTSLGNIDTSLIELLQLCCCWGHHQASLMLATLHLSGLGVPADQEKVAAQEWASRIKCWV